MSENKLQRDSERAVRTTLPPARSYEIPGGPFARNLGTVEVAKLAEIERGGEYDKVR